MGSLEVVRKRGQAYIRKQFFLHLLLILLDGKATLYSVFYHSAITKKCKAQISFMSMMFQEDSRSKRRKKNKLFLIYCFVLLGFLRAIVQSGKGLGASAVLSPPGQNHWKMPPWHLHTGMTKGSWRWRAEQGHREPSSAMPVSCCLARRGLRAARLLHDSERFWGRRCAFFCRKSEDIKGDAFATSAVGRSCVLCYLGIVFDWVRNAQRKRASEDFEAGACWDFLDFPRQVNKLFQIYSVFGSSFATGPRVPAWELNLLA